MCPGPNTVPSIRRASLLSRKCFLWAHGWDRHCVRPWGTAVRESGQATLWLQVTGTQDKPSEGTGIDSEGSRRGCILAVGIRAASPRGGQHAGGPLNELRIPSSTSLRKNSYSTWPPGRMPPPDSFVGGSSADSRGGIRDSGHSGCHRHRPPPTLGLQCQLLGFHSHIL